MDPLFQKAQVDLKERLEILPQELVDLIHDGILDAVVFDAVQKFGLTVEQKVQLENEIIFVLALFLPKDQFAFNVEESLGVAPDIADAIYRDVDTEIFELVSDILESAKNARMEVAASLGKIDLEKKMERREDLNNLAKSLSNPETARRAPEAVEVVEPIRTMEQDMHRVHGYGAYQEEREKEQRTEEATETMNTAPEKIAPGGRQHHS